MGARRKAARKRKPPVTSAARLAVALRERKEAIEQQAATAEILKVISSSPRDRRPAFDAILKSALRLCDAHLGVLNLREADGLRTVAQRGGSAEFAAWVFERGVFKPDGGAVLKAVRAGKAQTTVRTSRTSPALSTSAGCGPSLPCRCSRTAR